jgi:hypothetical protein
MVLMAHVDARIVALRQARFAELALAIGAFAIGTGEFAAMASCRASPMVLA